MLKKNNVWENLGRMGKTIDEMVAEYNQNGTITNYVEKRREINVEVIEAAVGIVFEPDEKGGYKGKLGIRPSNAELLEIQIQLNKLFDIEAKMTSGEDQDAIPGPNYVKLAKDANKIKDIYSGLIGNYGLVNRNIGCGDVVALAAVGDTLRKKYTKRNVIIIGSIVLATVAGGTIAYFVVKHNKKDQVVASNDDTTTIPEPEIIDLDDGEIVDLDDEVIDLDDKTA